MGVTEKIAPGQLHLSRLPSADRLSSPSASFSSQLGRFIVMCTESHILGLASAIVHAGKKASIT